MVTRPAREHVLGKILYGGLFVVALPATLTVWAVVLDSRISLPVPDHRLPALALSCLAGAVLVAGVVQLSAYGHGLPMNAYPPSRFVDRGIYAWIAHPIYLGAILLSAGVSLGLRSGSGLYLITPFLAAMILALLWGYELPALKHRFGDRTGGPLPAAAAGSGAVPVRVRIAVAARVFLPWLAAGYLLDHAGCVGRCGAFTWLGGVHGMHTAWALMWLAPFGYLVIRTLAARTVGRLRSAAASGIVAGASSIYLSLVVAVGPGGLARAGMPAAISALALAAGLWWQAAWAGLHRVAERVANSRHDWLLRGGGFRIINHAVYSGLAGAVGVGAAGYLLGSGRAALLQAACVLLGAAVFAQSLWGSQAILRPFGYWGAIVGGVAGAVLVRLLCGISLLDLVVTAAVVAPFGQAIGRLRCLAQGCCHGVVATQGQAIRVWHPQSRVVVLSDLKGAPLLTTQLYSICFNVLLGVLLGVLLVAMWWSRDVGGSFVLGTYLALTGAERFVEDAYRGERQTRMLAGMRENQWIAVAGVAAGIAVTMIPSLPPARAAGLDAEVVACALAGGLMSAFAMSMDFPRSTRRFSRLSG